MDRSEFDNESPEWWSSYSEAARLVPKFYLLIVFSDVLRR